MNSYFFLLLYAYTFVYVIYCNITQKLKCIYA